MKKLQDDLTYYTKQKQEIINNKQNYTSSRCHNEYGSWQNASYTFSCHNILAHHGTNWWYQIHWGKTGLFGNRNRYGLHMRSDTTTQASIRHDIAHNLGCPLDEINPQLTISPRGNEPTVEYDNTNKMFSSYTIGYQRRTLQLQQEKFFDQAKYDEVLKVCEQKINSAKAAITTFQQDAIEQERQQKIAAEQARLAAEAAEQARLDAVKHGNDIISANISKQQKANFDMFQSLNSKQRAFFLSELFGKSDSESMTMISIIKSLGVDADELAYYAIKKTHSGLFDLALSYGANCCNYSVAGKTLLQQLVHNGNESFIKKVLATSQDLASTVVEAIGQNDVVTISKLSSYDSSLLSQKFAGYTLLQIAISAQKTEIVQKILQLGSNSVEILTNNAESALKIAVRSGNDEIINMVAQHANLQIEIAQLGSKVEQALKDKILEYQDIETVIKLLRGEEISLQQYLLEQRSQDEEKIAAEQAGKAEEDLLAEETYLEQVQDIEYHQEDATLVTLQGLALDNPPH